MHNPDEYFTPDDGDPWHQQQQELEQRETESIAVTPAGASNRKVFEHHQGNESVQDSGDPF